ncbi:hypothetical protein B0T14DRAFT_499584 [Immersiella caudata]|uniref:Uncharacterized protein n=1 Tax=Immersiella caudata TaxID=314043 RepID=A0AA39WF59_9PEZI|nr:hypothetical protein B0T14DRAFT_499584 [Immersiella caudata]
MEDIINFKKMGVQVGNPDGMEEGKLFAGVFLAIKQWVKKRYPTGVAASHSSLSDSSRGRSNQVLEEIPTVSPSTYSLYAELTKGHIKDTINCSVRQQMRDGKTWKDGVPGLSTLLPYLPIPEPYIAWKIVRDRSKPSDKMADLLYEDMGYDFVLEHPKPGKLRPISREQKLTKGTKRTKGDENVFVFSQRFLRAIPNIEIYFRKCYIDESQWQDVNPDDSADTEDLSAASEENEVKLEDPYESDNLGSTYGDRPSDVDEVMTDAAMEKEHTAFKAQFLKFDSLLEARRTKRESMQPDGRPFKRQRVTAEDEEARKAEEVRKAEEERLAAEKALKAEEAKTAEERKALRVQLVQEEEAAVRPKASNRGAQAQVILDAEAKPQR